MKLDLFFLRRPASQALSTEPMRDRDGKFSPSAKTRSAQGNATFVRLQLTRYVNRTTPEQRATAMRDYERLAAMMRGKANG